MEVTRVHYPSKEKMMVNSQPFSGKMTTNLTELRQPYAFIKLLFIYISYFFEYTSSMEIAGETERDGEAQEESEGEGERVREGLSAHVDVSCWGAFIYFFFGRVNFPICSPFLR